MSAFVQQAKVLREDISCDVTFQDRYILHQLSETLAYEFPPCLCWPHQRDDLSMVAVDGARTQEQKLQWVKSGDQEMRPLNCQDQRPIPSKQPGKVGCSLPSNLPPTPAARRFPSSALPEARLQDGADMNFMVHTHQIVTKGWV